MHTVPGRQLKSVRAQDHIAMDPSAAAGDAAAASQPGPGVFGVPTPAGSISPAAPAASSAAPEGPTQVSPNPASSSIHHDGTQPHQQHQHQEERRASSLPLHLAGRVRSMHYQLQERPAADEPDLLPSPLLPTLSTRGAAGAAAEGEGSEGGDSDTLDWTPGSPDLRAGPPAAPPPPSIQPWPAHAASWSAPQQGCRAAQQAGGAPPAAAAA